jgi:hypothetical protein
VGPAHTQGQDDIVAVEELRPRTGLSDHDVQAVLGGPSRLHPVSCPCMTFPARHTVGEEGLDTGNLYPAFTRVSRSLAERLMRPRHSGHSCDSSPQSPLRALLLAGLRPPRKAVSVDVSGLRIRSERGPRKGPRRRRSELVRGGTLRNQSCPSTAPITWASRSCGRALSAAGGTLGSGSRDATRAPWSGRAATGTAPVLSREDPVAEQPPTRSSGLRERSWRKDALR